MKTQRLFHPVIPGRAAWGLVELLAFAGRVAGQTSHVYVAPDGNDAWSGRPVAVAGSFACCTRRALGEPSSRA